MRYVVGIALLCVSLYFAGIRQTNYDFVCRGSNSQNGVEKSIFVQGISFSLERFPPIQRNILDWGWGYGHFLSNQHLFKVHESSRLALLLQGADRKALGHFDRVSKHLVVNTGGEEFDLICVPAMAVS